MIGHVLDTLNERGFIQQLSDEASLRCYLEQPGTVYIGYAYYDDYGDEQIYWYPYEIIYDGDTGAIEYVPLA